MQQRLESLDLLRGIAIIAMVGYHFLFGLWWFGILTRSDGWVVSWWLWLERPWIEVLARSILIAFLVLAGMTANLKFQRLKYQQSSFSRISTSFAKQAAQLWMFAVGVTVATLAAVPTTPIWFGVLHLIAVMTLVAPILVRLKAGLTVVIGFIFLSWLSINSQAVEGWWLLPLGFSQQPMLDYVPLIPWAGYYLVGLATGGVVVQNTWMQSFQASCSWQRWLVAAGRHSLHIYLLHSLLLVPLLVISSLLVTML